MAIIPLFFGNEWTKEFGYIVLLIYSLIGMLTIAVFRDLKAFFMPSSVLFLYLSWSMTIGAWGHSMSAVLSDKQYGNYMRLSHVDASLAIFMLTLATLIPLSLFLNSRINSSGRSIRFPTYPLYVFIFILLPFLFFKIDLSVLGGKGTIGNIITSLMSISAVIIVANMRLAQRYLLYILIIALNASLYAFSKRYAIFLIFPILYLESSNVRFKFDLPFVIKSIVSFIVVAGLIIVMSIYRGYGGFEPGTFINSFRFVGQYLSSDLFLPFFLNNIEANYTFFHAVNAIEMIFLDPEKITFGSTFASFIFLPLPREVFPWKPDGIITLYTTAYDPYLRAKGGSAPINVVAELIWNFWLFAPIVGVVLVWILAKLELILTIVREKRHSLSMVFYLFAYMSILSFARGGGTNILLFELLVAALFMLLARILSILLFSSRSP
ncbi:hypothetical protein OAE57_01100 [Synechococcus sp. AH-551-C10]|nr:hypothetical protein [Synechococcus sp. AH-551-C10]MDB4659650.1 hypothetical protein [Synechococcus sp. AH-551-C10]